MWFHSSVSPHARQSVAHAIPALPKRAGLEVLMDLLSWPATAMCKVNANRVVRATVLSHSLEGAAQDGKVDILDMSTAMSPFKQILQLLQTGGSASMAGTIAELAAHLGFIQQHQHSFEGTRVLAELEAVLSDRHQQSGPQLLSDYVLPR